jgi:hypothetical protein
MAKTRSGIARSAVAPKANVRPATPPRATTNASGTPSRSAMTSDALAIPSVCRTASRM